MLLETILFELRYQLKGPAFWTSAIAFFLFSFSAMCMPYIHVASTNIVLKNGSTPILYIHCILTIFFMFAAVAMAADVIVRDQNTGFGPMIYTTRLRKADYVFGRIFGAFMACAICFAVVPIGLWFGTIMPWVDSETMMPFSPQPYIFGYFLLGLPTIFFLVTLFSGLSAMTRSVMSSYMGVLTLFVGFSLANAFLLKSEEIARCYSILQPYGIAALARVTQYWTPVECNSKIPICDGDLLANRCVCLAAGLAFMLLTSAALKLDSNRTRQRRKKLATTDSPVNLELNDSVNELKLPSPQFDTHSKLIMFWARTRLECRQIIVSPSFVILSVICIVLAMISENAARKLYGTDLYPVTRMLLQNLRADQFLFSLIFSTFYSGELIWREREVRIDEIIDGSPLSNGAYLFPKCIALLLVLLSTILILIATEIIVQTLKGYTNFELHKYILWFAAPQMVQCSILALTGILTQVLAPRKVIGWAIMLVLLVLQLVPSMLNFSHPLVQFGIFPEVPLSDMNGEGQFWIARAWFQLLWGSLAVLMLCLSNLLWRRGVSTSLKSRFKMLPDRAKIGSRIFATSALAVFILTGSYIFYNTNVLNEFWSTTDHQDVEADFEKKYRDVSSKPQPSIVDIKLTIDLFPHEISFLARGKYILKNETSKPITNIYLDFPYDIHYKELAIEGAVPKPVEAKSWIKEFTCQTPMLPGETRTMTFDSEFRQKGFPANGLPTYIVDNGTFMPIGRFAPVVGIPRPELITDKSVRKQHNLPPLQRMKPLTDQSARDVCFGGGSWSKTDITISTEADQTPLAPGKKISDKSENGRRTSRFISEKPIQSYFTLQSARYKERHLLHKGVDLVVYYDAQHATNINRMLEALSAALDYCQKNFGPFQFPNISIIEFPDYQVYAQSLASTIPYSEGLGFVADIKDPGKIDYVTFITAHELAHQWWGHQVANANVQGATMITETLAQYTALMVMEKILGPAQVRKFLEYESDSYLKKRQSEAVAEQPLYKVENQGYIHYNKGAVVMYLLRHQIGEEAVNRALRNLLKSYKFKGPPYPISTDLVTLLRKEAGPKNQQLITDLFEKITIYDFRAKEAKLTQLADGHFSVSLRVQAFKNYANGQGEQTSADFNEPVDIGFFTADPRNDNFTARDVLLIEKRVLKTGEQWVKITLDRRPRYAGVDPYRIWIDKYPSDNVVKVN